MISKKNLDMRVCCLEGDTEWIFHELDNLKDKIKEISKEKKTVKRTKKNEEINV